MLVVKLESDDFDKCEGFVRIGSVACAIARAKGANNLLDAERNIFPRINSGVQLGALKPLDSETLVPLSRSDYGLGIVPFAELAEWGRATKLFEFKMVRDGGCEIITPVEAPKTGARPISPAPAVPDVADMQPAAVAPDGAEPVSIVDALPEIDPEFKPKAIEAILSDSPLFADVPDVKQATHAAALGEVQSISPAAAAPEGVTVLPVAAILESKPQAAPASVPVSPAPAMPGAHVIRTTGEPGTVCRLKKAALIEKYRHTWPTAAADIANGRNGLDVASLGKGFYDEAKAVIWATERGKFKENILTGAPKNSILDSPTSVRKRME